VSGGGKAIAAILGLAGLAAAWGALALREPEAPEAALPASLAAALERPFEESHAARDLAARKRALLSSYGWVDRERGTVRIPIERAIDLSIARAAKAAKEREDEAKEPDGGDKK
jgi:hypothetical protein